MRQFLTSRRLRQESQSWGLEDGAGKERWLMWVSGRRPLLCLDVWRNGACRAVTILSRVALGAQRAALVRRTMASSASHGPVYTAIVRKVTESLAPEALELHDDSASHAGHAGMKGREAVEVCVCSSALSCLCSFSWDRWLRALVDHEAGTKLRHGFAVTLQAAGRVGKI